MDPALAPDPASILRDFERRLHTLERTRRTPGAGAQEADVTAVEDTTSATYTDLATLGPSVTLTLAAGQPSLVIVSATMSGASALMTPQVTGAGTLAALDVNAALVDLAAGERARSTRAMVLFAASTAGGYTFTAKYRATAGTATFGFRRIIAIPL